MNEIKIDLELLVNNNLTISEYCYLYLLYHKKEFKWSLFQGLDVDNFLGLLEIKGYIKISEFEYGLPILRKKSLILFEISTPETNFYRFWSMYPIKVTNGKGGYRVLRSKDTDSKQAKDLKTKYLKLIKTPGIHEKIILGLDNYLKSLRPSMQFCVGVEVFINQAIYEKYYDIEEEQGTNEISI